MIDVPLAYAFTAGLVAAVNPCGFPMLPAYLSFFIGTDDEDVAGGTRVPRALLSGLAVSVGFLAVFAALHGGLLLMHTMHSTAPLEAALDGALAALRAGA